MEQTDPLRLYTAHLRDIERLIRGTGRRRFLTDAELEDFATHVHARLVEDRYALIRKFGRRSAFWTYLAVVIEHLSRDFRVARWQGWRPSLAAARYGSLAILLEQLVFRDLNSVDEAIDTARTKHGVALTPGELRAVWAALESAKKRFPPN